MSVSTARFPKIQPAGVLLGYPLSSVGAVFAALVCVFVAWQVPVAPVRGVVLGLAAELVVLGLVRVGGRSLLQLVVLRMRFDRRARRGWTRVLPWVPNVRVGGL